VRLGIGITLGRAASPADLIARRARAAEANGFDSVWFFDSISRSNPSIDPLIGASIAAAVTERIEVGTGILQIPLRNPVELANRVLTTQLFSGNRLLFGVGAGSTRADFDALGLSFDDRMPLFNDGLATMRRLWAGEVVGTANLRPIDEVRGGPPVFIGSWAGPKWIPRAAREFDGWIASGHFAGYDTLKSGIEAYREAGGKRALVTNIWLDLEAPTQALDDAKGPYSLQCDPQTAAERLQRLADLGYDDAVVVHHGQGEPDFAAIRALLPR
jgi:alkanesulfonate monooxygenase SsuD/methylene tetrahydromethanopterin reductase-like flavin-dependent oxidoreductase (luciferase family)